MATEIEGTGHHSKADPAPARRRRGSTRPVVGAVKLRPMTADAQTQFRAAMQRALVVLVEQAVRGCMED